MVQILLAAAVRIIRTVSEADSIGHKHFLSELETRTSEADY